MATHYEVYLSKKEKLKKINEYCEMFNENAKKTTIIQLNQFSFQDDKGQNYHASNELIDCLKKAISDNREKLLKQAVAIYRKSMLQTAIDAKAEIINAVKEIQELETEL